MCEYGYLNHSFTDNHDGEAITAMFAALPCERVTVEQLRGRDENPRPAFEALLAKLQPNDTLYVHSLDRLGLDVSEVVRIWQLITQKKRAHVVVLENPGLDSRKNPLLTLLQIRIAAEKAFDPSQQSAVRRVKPFSALQLARSCGGE